MGYDFERCALGYTPRAPWIRALGAVEDSPWARLNFNFNTLVSWIRAPGAVEDPPWARLNFNFNTTRNKNTTSESMPARTTVTP